MATIIGTNSNNSLNGTTSADTIIGRAGNDTVNGSGGNDRLNGGIGNDIVNGGTGTDTADYSNLVISGTTYIGATAGVRVNLNLTSAQNTGGAGTDTLVSIENLIGTNFNDSLTGNAGNNVLSGLAGNDTLLGGGGNDQLTGGTGNDRLDGGTGIDTASYSTATAGVTVGLNLTGTQDTVGAGIDTLVSIENLVGSNFNDTLYGNDATNTLFGGAGEDVLAGGSGGDRLDGGTGADEMFGGLGNDTFIVDHANDFVFELFDDMRPVPSVDSVESSVSHTLTSRVEHLTLTGSATISGTGNELNNQITGNSANNVLSGLNGNDLLRGGLGADLLSGGSGNDTFDYNALSDSPAGAGRDVIQDFRGNFDFEVDRIDLRDIDGNGLLAGNQAFSWIGSNSFTAAGQLRYSSITGILQGNTDADAAPEFEIQLIGGPVLTVNSIVSDILL